MTSEKILVTGGLGAIGSFVTRHFIENGYTPIVFDSRPDFSLVSDLKEQFELVLGDIMDFPALSRIVKENKIKEVWNSQNLKIKRQKHLSSMRNKLVPCDRCGVNFE